MKLTEMKQILDSGAIRLTRSLGQNFLFDANQLRKIVQAADLNEANHILEIGPGLGPLTQLLVQSGAHVLALEIDRRLYDHLANQFAGVPNLELVHVDALQYLKECRRDWTDWKLVANLPYSVASPMLVELAQADGPPERMVATLQLEVAQRLMAEVGSEHYGLLTLLVQLRFEACGWFKIPASCFYPQPDVDSACVTLIRREVALLARAQEPVFEKLIRRSFSQRRKMMLKLLKTDWPERELRRAFDQIGLAPEVRAEKVSLEAFVRLTRELAPEQDRGA